MAASDKITVAVRVRPLGEHGVGDIVVHDKHASSIIIGVDRSFTFDHIFPSDSNQSEVYNTLVAPLIKNCLYGINATVLAYGQTGSGKTYTMGTSFDIDDFSMNDCVGIIPRAIVDIFEQIDSMTESDYAVEAQFIELYNEELRDLLTPKKNVVKIQEKVGGGIYLSGATTIRINCVNDALHIIRAGGESRSTGSTKMNAQSSRSHAILTLHISQRKKVEGETRVELISSKFHFVDLAGSERLGRTGAEGERAKEGIKINFGLLALGNVINALSENQRHVPYRDSKLTRLLCDSLGGNSRTVLIACISPAEIDMAESVNTLQYATRAKKIRNTISVNVTNMTSTDAETLKKLLIENRRLRQQLKMVTAQASSSSMRSMPYQLPPGRVTSKPPLNLRVKENLVQIANAFDKVMVTRVKQMSEITSVGAARFHKKMKLNNVKVQHAVLDGCGDPKANQLVPLMRSLEREIDEASVRVTDLAEALRNTGATIHDLLGRVERAITAFPPAWQYVPQTIRSAMSTRLSNSDSSGLQCYNSNLNKILQYSEIEQAGTLALIQQLHEIAGPSLLRRYQPSLLSKVSNGDEMRADVFDDGNSIQQAGPSISSLLPGLLDGNVKRKPGLATTARPATAGAVTESRRGVGIRKPAVPRLRKGASTQQNQPPVTTRPYSAGAVATATTSTALNNPARMSYVAAANCNSIPEEYLNMLENTALTTTINFKSAPSVEPLMTPGPSKSLEERLEPPRTIVRPVRTSPRNLPQAVVPPMPVVEVEDVEMRSMEKPAQPVSSVRHHHVPMSSRVVWHNGLPLPVVDSPEQENCPPSNDVSMREISTSDSKPQSTEVLRNFQPTKRPITDVDSGDDDTGRTRVITTPAGDLPAGGEDIANFKKAIEEQEGSNNDEGGDREEEEGTVDAAVGSRESGKRTKFTLRRSIMERFQRCGIDFNTFAPP
ncbi:unnamed protein product [Rodentolepis nana]|uniref:Kinesin-like protein n=1 Tax=Rodentolepis nana TaxID=102285 RepID=A0A158QIU8_RODNA|nr:unnamed protein product [Rodentolepis nana]